MCKIAFLLNKFKYFENLKLLIIHNVLYRNRNEIRVIQALSLQWTTYTDTSIKIPISCIHWKNQVNFILIGILYHETRIMQKRNNRIIRNLNN